jgi:hypothetical protein
MYKEGYVASPQINGEVQFEPAQIASRPDGDELVLMHVSTGRFAALNPIGKQIWELLEKGTRDIPTLIKEHSEQTKASSEVSAYQVLSFLDELRANGFIQYTLSGEKETAPLLDISLEEGAGRTAAEANPGTTSSSPRRTLVYIRQLNPTMTMAEAKQIAERTAGHEIEQVDQILVFNAEEKNLTFNNLERLAHSLETPNPMFPQVASVELPPPSFSIQDAENLARKPSGADPEAVVGPPGGPIIITINGIVIVGGPGGVRFGKSRSACKTACV